MSPGRPERRIQAGVHWTRRAANRAAIAACVLATAVVVRLDSPGPILFRQERVGRDGIPFTLLKFRSMRADAEAITGPVWASEDDPRITRAEPMQ